jgi:16S rRNA (guanine527-N7)-methyltransferase
VVHQVDIPVVRRMLAALADRYDLPSTAKERLRLLLALLVDDPLAPTAVREPATAIDDHFADSLVALELPVLRSASAIADIGAGAGLPGLPLAIALPGAGFATVESSGRRCEFIQRAALRCEIRNVEVVNARAESWPEGLGRFDVVTARALAPLDVVAEYAAPLLRTGGTLVVWRGRRDFDAEHAGVRAAERLGLEVGEIRQVRPYAGAKHRHLHLMSKVMETPPEFPRRPGAASKRPLGTHPRSSDRSRR